MLSYIFKRLLLTIPVLLGVATVTFVLMFVIPGDPIQGMVGERASPQTIQSIREELGLDRPFVVQYGLYLGRIVRGDFGRSYWTNQDVFMTLCQRFPNTARLALASMVMAVLLGITLGILPALFRDPRTSLTIDRWTTTLCTLSDMALSVFLDTRSPGLCE